MIPPRAGLPVTRAAPGAALSVPSLILLLALLVAACTPAPQAAPPATGAPTAAPTTAAAKPAAPPAATTTEGKPAAAPAPTSAPAPAAKPAGRQAIRVPLTEPPTLDPGLAEDTVSIEVIMQVFEGLVTFDEKGKISGLGAEKWEVSPDGLTYTFTLRQGPKWSDGKPVVAADYAWAWQRNIDPKTASPYANTLFPIKNAVAINDGKLPPEQLGVEARDDRTLVVSLEKPAGYFLRLASTWTLMPLRQDVVTKHGDKWTEAANVVSNGPFRLKEWQHEVQIVIERDDAYWGVKPTLQQVTYRLYPEGGADQVLAAYEANEIDTTGTHSFELPANQVDRIRADSRLKNELATWDESATNFITVNTRRPHLKDPRVRQALGLALDRKLILEQVLKREGQPADDLQPEGIVGRNPSMWPKGDVAAAKRLLNEAGYPDGRGFPQITFAYNTSAQWKPFAEHLQARWKEALGLDVKLDSMEWAVFLKYRRGDDWVQKGDLYRGGWFSDYEDPNNWYNVLWDSQSDALAFNTGWKHDEYDRIVRQAAAETSPERREALYAQAEQILAREHPVIPVFHYRGRALVKPWVKGFTPTRVMGLTPVRTITIEERR